MTADGRRAIITGGSCPVTLWDLEEGCTVRELTHVHSAWSVAITPDGARAVTGGRSLTVWDLDTNEEEPVTFGQHGDGYRAVAISPDGQLVTGAAKGIFFCYSVPHGPTWRANINQPLVALSCDMGNSWDSEGGVALTPDGRWAIFGSRGSDYYWIAQVWDLQLGRKRWSLHHGRDGSSLSVAISDDGRRAACGSSDRKLTIWDLDTGEGRTTQLPQTGTQTVAFVNGGRDVVCANSNETNIAAITFIDAESPAAASSGHSKAVTALVVTADGRSAVSGSRDGTLKLWDVPTGDLARNVAVDLGGDFDVVLASTPDGRSVVSAAGTDGVRIRDLDGVRPSVPIATYLQSFRVLALAPQRNWVLAASNSKVHKWDLTTGNELEPFDLPNDDWVNGLAVTANNRVVVAMNETLSIHELDSGRLLRPIELQLGGARVSALALSPDSQRVAIGSSAGEIQVFDLADHYVGHYLTYNDHILSFSRVLALAIGVNGHRLIASHASRTLTVWDFDTLEMQAVLAMTAPITALAIHGSRILVGDTEGALHCIDYIESQPQTGDRGVAKYGPRAAERHQDANQPSALLERRGLPLSPTLAFPTVDAPAITSARLSSLVQTPGGSVIVNRAGHPVSAGRLGRDVIVAYQGGRTDLRVWDLTTREPCGPWLSDPDPEKAAVGEFAGRPVLACAGRGGTVRVWDANSRDRLGQLENEDAMWIDALAVKEVGTDLLVVVSDDDDGVQVWDLTTAASCTPRFRGWSGAVQVALGDLHGEPVLVTADREGLAYLWSVASGTRIGEPIPIGHFVQRVALTELGGRRILISAGSGRGGSSYRGRYGETDWYTLIQVRDLGEKHVPDTVELLDEAWLKSKHDVTGIAAGYIDDQPVIVSTSDIGAHVWSPPFAQGPSTHTYIPPKGRLEPLILEVPETDESNFRQHVLELGEAMRSLGRSSVPTQQQPIPKSSVADLTASQEHDARERRCYVLNESEIEHFGRFYSADPRFPCTIAVPGTPHFIYHYWDTPPWLLLSIDASDDLGIRYLDLKARAEHGNMIARAVVAGTADVPDYLQATEVGIRRLHKTGKELSTERSRRWRRQQSHYPQWNAPKQGQEDLQVAGCAAYRFALHDRWKSVEFLGPGALLWSIYTLHDLEEDTFRKILDSFQFLPPPFFRDFVV